MTRTTLYFGSFNPIHNGHTAVASYVVERELCDQLWFVVSPQNPLKQTSGMASAEARLEMARLAAREMGYGERVDVCGIEFALPKPSYTINTLRALVARYPQREFSLLVGGDIVGELEKWRDYREILDNFPLLVYPREGYSARQFEERITLLADAPTWQFSSTEVREAISSGKDISEMVGQGVYQYISEHKLWS